MRKEITKEHLPYRFLTPEGLLDLESAVASFDPTYEKTLVGKRLKALVTQVSPDQKTAQVSMGIVSAQISLEDLKWAGPVSNPSKAPKTVVEVLHPGDIIWVKVKGLINGVWRAKLTQIPEIQGALYSVDVETGQILAMVGGYDYETSEFNRSVQAKRQMGSTFKPIIYSAAVESGYTPVSIIVDSPVVF
jgi:penicillin-binding protein 1A